MPGPNTHSRRSSALAKRLEKTRSRVQELDNMNLVALAAEVKQASARTNKRHYANHDGPNLKQRTAYGKGLDPDSPLYNIQGCNKELHGKLASSEKTAANLAKKQRNSNGSAPDDGVLMQLICDLRHTTTLQSSRRRGSNSAPSTSAKTKRRPTQSVQQWPIDEAVETKLRQTVSTTCSTTSKIFVSTTPHASSAQPKQSTAREEEVQSSVQKRNVSAARSAANNFLSQRISYSKSKPKRRVSRPSLQCGTQLTAIEEDSKRARSSSSSRSRRNIKDTAFKGSGRHSWSPVPCALTSLELAKGKPSKKHPSNTSFIERRWYTSK